MEVHQLGRPGAGSSGSVATTHVRSLGLRLLVLPLLVLVPACASPTSATDAETQVDAACTSESCDNELFCDGVESCVAGSCSAGSPPCQEGCDEANDRCQGCEDLDGDGARDAACGGSDCDDANPIRFPGALEICDAIDRDEDCDPATFGVLDADLDGFADRRCCNVDGGGQETCGTDCDDASAFVNPSAPEVCDLVDNDCDGDTDEDAAPATWYRDADGDGAGNDAMTTTACTPPGGYVLIGGDCDDGSSARRPGRPEICDGVDNDCNTTVDDGTIAGIGADCATGESGECNRGVVVCSGLAGPTCTRRMPPATSESCNALDDDCDTRVDEAVTGVGAGCAVPAAQGVCAAGTRICDGAAGLRCQGPPASMELCSAADENCNGSAYDGFACVPGATAPCSQCGVAGTQTCSAGCSFGSCALAATTAVRRSGTDPVFNFPGSCSPTFGCYFGEGPWQDAYTSPPRRICDGIGLGGVPYRHPNGSDYCIAGGAVVLAPGTYRARVRFNDQGQSATSFRPVLEAWDVTVGPGLVRASASYFTSFSSWNEAELNFTHPGTDCGTYEFRVPYHDTYDYSFQVEWIEYQRTGP